MKRISKNDIIFIVILVVLVGGVAMFFSLRPQNAGAQVVVTVDGEEYGRYSLNEDTEVPIELEGVTTNLLVIKDGEADMTEADCPDKLCVHQKAISKNHETIVCLPNKVVVEITGSEESGFDTIAK